MKMAAAIDRFITDMRAAGRINSDRTEVTYRGVLHRHADDCGNRDPRTTNRDDCKRTLAHWANPNTQRCSRAVLVSFYRWAMEEGIRRDNPGEQTRRPKPRPTTVYRMTRAEAAAMLAAAQTSFERRAIHLGICAGLRSAELRGLRGEHFDRAGFVWVSADIAKGGRERWVPVIDELAPVVAEIRGQVAREHHVLPGTHIGGFGANAFRREYPSRGASSQVLQRTVHRVAKRAGIQAHIHPHLMRHAFADHIARASGLGAAQALLGHADLRTTQHYLGGQTIEELAAAVAGVSFKAGGHPPQTGPQTLERRGRDSNPRSEPAKGNPGKPRGDPDGDPAHRTAG